MKLPERCAGVLAHVSSLPGAHGAGDFGPAAWRFADWLAEAGQAIWQVLPLNPIGPGDSPYQSVSAFAGNPLLVALEPLVASGWLAPPELPAGGFDGGRIDFGRLVPWRLAQLRAAAAGFQARADESARAALAAWAASQAAWLDDYALFMAIEQALGGQPWWCWPPPLRDRQPAALAAARLAHGPEIAFQQFVQWCFDTQLAALKSHAHARGVALMGDLPIFIAHHSADCWARPELYELDAAGQPTVVAGVPPDSQTPDGQRWGNPLYRWDRMAAEGWAWWTARLQRLLAQVDIFRIDHFRGFAGCWEVPAACPTAREGRWAPGPGAALFDAAQAVLGPLPVVAEDLGHITPDVVALRERYGWPGMRIVHEGFIYGPQHPFLPHHHVPACLAYTSTHDSDTVCGWWEGSPPTQRAFATTYLGLPAAAQGPEVARAVVRATAASVAQLALAALQDLLELGSAHRMNRPGTLGGGNWGWRFDWSMVPADLAARCVALAAATDRLRSTPTRRGVARTG